MSLSKKQQKFTVCVSMLLVYAQSNGYGLTLGDAYRDPRAHGDFGEKGSYSAAKSTHKVRLALDLNLFVDNVWISDGDHAAWRDMGEYWETLDQDARWGGWFQDSNHFSFEHWGCK